MQQLHPIMPRWRASTNSPLHFHHAPHTGHSAGVPGTVAAVTYALKKCVGRAASCSQWFDLTLAIVVHTQAGMGRTHWLKLWHQQSSSHAEAYP